VHCLTMANEKWKMTYGKSRSGVIVWLRRIAISNTLLPHYRKSEVLVADLCSPLLLITQSVHRILAGGPERWVERADSSSEQSHAERHGHPLRFDLHRQRGGTHHGKASDKSQSHSGHDAEQAYQHGFLLNGPGNRCLRHAKRLENTDLSRALSHRGVHREQNYEHADRRGHADHNVQKNVQRRDARSVQLFQIPGENNLIVGEALLNAGCDFILPGGIDAGDQDRAASALGPELILERGQR